LECCLKKGGTFFSLYLLLILPINYIAIMKIVDAFWEKRNLGVECKEITIESTDDVSVIEGIDNLLNNIDYLVLKVPLNRFDVYSLMPKLGFAFIEGSINFELSLKQAQLSSLQQRLNAAVGYTEMTVNDLNVLYHEIKEGMFGTDRILLDPFFTPEMAANRYINWIDDELKRETKAYKIVYKEDSIGFFTFKESSKGVYYPFLAGLYKSYSASGLGFTTLRKPIDEAIKRGGNLISTFASTNNLPVVRAHTQQGFSIKQIHYVFVKHNVK
jgi:hypothetical protein